MLLLEVSIVSVSFKIIVKLFFFICDFGFSLEYSFRKVNRFKRCYVICILKFIVFNLYNIFI